MRRAHERQCPNCSTVSGSIRPRSRRVACVRAARCARPCSPCRRRRYRRAHRRPRAPPDPDCGAASAPPGAHAAAQCPARRRSSRRAPRCSDAATGRRRRRPPRPAAGVVAHPARRCPRRPAAAAAARSPRRCRSRSAPPAPGRRAAAAVNPFLSQDPPSRRGGWRGPWCPTWWCTIPPSGAMRSRPGPQGVVQGRDHEELGGVRRAGGPRTRRLDAVLPGSAERDPGRWAARSSSSVSGDEVSGQGVRQARADRPLHLRRSSPSRPHPSRCLGLQPDLLLGTACPS